MPKFEHITLTIESLPGARAQVQVNIPTPMPGMRLETPAHALAIDALGWLGKQPAVAGFVYGGQPHMPPQCLHQIAEPATQEPFMWAIQGPDGSAYMDEGCVSSIREDVQAEVDGLNSGLDANDEPYQVVPVYLAAAPQAVQAAVPDGWQMVPAKPTEAMVGAIMSEGEVDAVAGLAPELRPILLERAGIAARYTAMLAAAPAHPAEAVPAQCPNINEPRGCWRVACQLGGKCREPERSATQPAAQGMEALPMQASEGVEDVAVMEHPEWMLVHKETGAQKPLDSQWTVRAAQPAAQGAATTGYIAPKGRYVPPVLFSPYTGEPRDARDIASDPRGILIVPPGAALAAQAKQGGAA